MSTGGACYLNSRLCVSVEGRGSAFGRSQAAVLILADPAGERAVLGIGEFNLGPAILVSQYADHIVLDDIRMLARVVARGFEQ